MRIIIAILLCLLLQNARLEAKLVVYDREGMDMSQFFIRKNTCYVIKYHHAFDTPVTIPEGCEISFRGGGLSGEIEFHNTKLSGGVNLKGSSIKGSVKNKQFDASWLCFMDGETDDARSINEMIEVCGKVYFPKGRYKLITNYDSDGKVPSGYNSSIRAHIGIRKNNVHLEGESGTVLVTEQPLGTICIFSQPKQIENSVGNIVIKNIDFEVHNDGVNFHEFMHTIKTIGVDGLLIEGCTFHDFWGDAICLSHYGDTPKTGERTRNSNVKIINNTINGGKLHNNRNGISIISGMDVLIKGNIINETSRKDMPGGIDIEPNNSAYIVENIKVIDNVLDGIQGNGGAIGICVFDGGPAHGITIKGNRISNSVKGIQLNIKTEGTTSDIVIKNNFVADDTRPYCFIGEGKSIDWEISGNIFAKPCLQNIPGKIKVENLMVKNNKKKD